MSSLGGRRAFGSGVWQELVVERKRISHLQEEVRWVGIASDKVGAGGEVGGTWATGIRV